MAAEASAPKRVYRPEGWPLWQALHDEPELVRSILAGIEAGLSVPEALERAGVPRSSYRAFRYCTAADRKLKWHVWHARRMAIHRAIAGRARARRRAFGRLLKRRSRRAARLIAQVVERTWGIVPPRRPDGRLNLRPVAD